MKIYNKVREARKTKIGRGDPVGLTIRSPLTEQGIETEDPIDYLKSNSDSLISYMKLTSSDNEIRDTVYSLNKSITKFKKDLENLGKFLLSKLAKKDQDILTDSKLKEISDTMQSLANDVQKYTDFSVFLKTLHSQVEKEKKKAPANHDKPKKKLNIKPKDSDNNKKSLF